MKNNEIVLSVVIPVYNVEQYLSRCLESVCGAWKNGVEVILVDDGSTDGSGAICDEYAHRWPYISVIHQKNKGLSAARNSGTRFAQGKYVAYVDSDDWVEKEWIELLLEVIHQSYPDIVVFDFYISSSETDDEWIRYSRPAGMLKKEMFLVDVAKDMLIQSFAWNKAAKRELWLKTPFDENVKCLEDYEMICRMIQGADTVYHIQKPLYHYWQRPASLIHDHDFEQTWNSFLLSLKRAEELGEHYAAPTSIACCIQAYRVCRKYAEKKYANSAERTKDARRYLRKHVRTALMDKEVAAVWKTKFLLACMGVL